MIIPKTILLISLLHLTTVFCLYEDQVSKWDFRHRFIGKLKYLASTEISSSQQTIILGTDKNVLTSLHLKNGSINWRHILEPNLEFNLATGVIRPPSTSGVANANKASSEDDSDVDGFEDEEDAFKEIITVTGNGLYVRGWDPVLGTLNFEQRLPEDVVSENEGQERNFLYSIESKENQLLIAKLDGSNRKLSIRAYNYKTRAVSEISTLTAGKWLKSIQDCKFVGENQLVCLDLDSLSVYHLILKQKGEFKAISLTNLGLKTKDNPSYLKLVTFEKQPSPEEPYFAIDLGGDGFVFARIASNGINLVKILPKVKQMSIESVDLSASSSPKYAVFALISKPENSKDNPSDEVSSEDDRQLKQFKVAVFNLDNWEENKSMMGHFMIKSLSPVIIDNMFIIPIQQGSKYYYKILISTRDGSLFLTSTQGKLSWRREEALSSIVAAEIIDLPLSELDASIEQTFGLHSTNIAQLFTNRITNQIVQLQNYFANVAQNIMETVSQKRETKRQTNDDDSVDLNGELSASHLMRDKFGLHKLIVALTKVGKVFGIDTVTGKIVWSFFDEDLSNCDTSSSLLPLFVQRTTSYYPYPARCTIVNKKGKIVSFDPITGEVVDTMDLKTQLKQVMMLSHVDETHLKGILLMSKENRVHLYPSSTVEVFTAFKNVYYLAVGEDSTGLLEGYSFSGFTPESPTAERVWSLSVPLSESNEPGKLRILFKRPGEHVHSQGRVLGDRSVLYKYLNPNLMVVVYEGLDPSASEFGKRSNYINLHLIDAVKGSVLYSVINKRAKGPVFVVHSENSIVYSYYNEKARRTEISSIELYEGKSQENATSFSSVFRLNLKPPIVEHQSYIFPTGIHAMVDTITEKGITNKHLLIALPSGGILELPKAFVDPRRPITPTPEHREEGLIPYIPELPIPSEGIINYNKSLLNVKDIVTAPSSLESTCLVFAYGLDIFYTRVTPSKTFDILKDDFDHWLIAGVLLILILFSYLTKWLAARKSLNNAWK